MSHFEQVVGDAGVEPIPSSPIRVTGADRVRFLEGMLTCEVEGLSPGDAREGLQLDRKGHVLALTSVLVLEAEVLLLPEPGSAAPLLEVLEKHVIADDVTLEPLTGWSGIAVEGPGSHAALEGVGAPAPMRDRGARASWRGHDLLALGGGRLGGDGVRVYADGAALEPLAAALDLNEIGGARAEVLRIALGVPALGIDVGARNFPQEARLEARVSFTKGCYIGQEIVARIQSRGAVRRALVRLQAESAFEPLAEIRDGERAVGALTSAAVLPDGRGVALGYVPVALARAGQRLRVGALDAVVA